MKFKSLPYFLFLAILSILLVGCDSLNTGFSGGSDDNLILASGVIEANQISIASELSGRVADVLVEEGDNVTIGDLVFTLEDDLLLTQKAQAQAQHNASLGQLEGARAAEKSAQAALSAAETILSAAEIQYQQVLAEVQVIQGSDRVADWNEIPPSQIDIPAWYFQQSEQISAALAEVSQAWDFYQSELNNYQETSDDIGSEDFQEAEKRLAEAQAAFLVADALNDRNVGYEGREDIEDFVDTIYDKAEAELKAAQKALDQILADPEYQEILEARARVSVAKERYDLAQDYHNDQLKGEYSLEVQGAKALVAQAEAGILQAEAQLTQANINIRTARTSVAQAEAGLDLVNLQIEKLNIYSPITGTILTRIINKGEIISAGFSTITVGDLTQLTVTVYLPENRYGEVKIGDLADLFVDSFPDKLFDAEVIRIADQAEYTPRNVQTQEERQNTVYAVKLAVKDLPGNLKPGMPADVTFHP